MKQFYTAFKKRTSGKLLWLTSRNKNEKEAMEEAQIYMGKFHANQGYNLYAGPLEQTK